MRVCPPSLLLVCSQLIRGNTFAGTAFSSYGAFWLGWGLWKYWEATGVMKSVASTAMTGDSLWCGLWGFLTLFFFVVTLRKNGCLQTVFFTLALTFFLLIGANYSAQCKKAAGYVGFFCGCSAIYTALAEIYEVRVMCVCVCHTVLHDCACGMVFVPAPVHMTTQVV